MQVWLNDTQNWNYYTWTWTWSSWAMRKLTLWPKVALKLSNHMNSRPQSPPHDDLPVKQKWTSHHLLPQNRSQLTPDHICTKCEVENSLISAYAGQCGTHPQKLYQLWNTKTPIAPVKPLKKLNSIVLYWNYRIKSTLFRRQNCWYGR